MIYPESYKAYQLLHEGVQAFARAERQGFHVDVPYVEKKLAFIEKKMNRLEENFLETEFCQDWQKSIKGKKININSLPQLSDFLYKTKGIKPTVFTSGGKDGESEKGSVNAEALKKLKIPELSFYEERTRLKKASDVLGGFLKEQVNGVIHPFYHLHLVRTFRSSSSNPNFQNIPKRDKELMKICRRALFPRPGHQLFEPDFSGIEVRVGACYHKDKNMLKYIHDPTTDMHGDMAQQIFMIDHLNKNIPGQAILRQAAKNGFVFPQFYGDYYGNNAESLIDWGKLPEGKWKYGQGIIIDEIGKPFKPYYLSDHMIGKGIKSYDKFVQHVKEVEADFWGNRFSGYQKWKDSHYEDYKSKGYVDLKTGFRCHGIMSKNDVSNYPVQGAAFHCLLWTFIELDKFIIANNLDTRIIGQIHDSIILDVHPDELELIAKTVHRIATEELRKHWDWIIVPMEIDAELCPVDAPWTEKEKFKFN
jgi:DNA polymerase I-like protein with 3'-5' exonuclease and polymerase domains